PAALALVYFAPRWAARIRGRWRLPLGILYTAGVSIATVAVVSVGTGLGLGWVTALSTPTVVHNGLSVSTDVGDLLAALSRALALPVADDTWVTGARTVGVILAMVACAAVWFRRNRLGTPASVGLALGALVLLGPVVHPWYLL